MPTKYRIVSAMNGKVITVSQGQRKTEKFALILEQYVNHIEQQFFIEKSYENQYIIRSVAFPDKVIDVTNESKEVYKEIVVYEGHGKPNQKWIITDLPNNTAQIMSLHSALVLEIQGGIDADGMLVVQNTNYRNKSQIWRI